MNGDMKKAIAIEQKEHPWADEEIARKLVEDHLRDDPNYYGDEEEGPEEEDDSALFGPTRDDDPYPEEELGPDEEELGPKHGPKHDGGKPELVIAIGTGKPKHGKGEDPYPED